MNFPVDVLASSHLFSLPSIDDTLRIAGRNETYRRYERDAVAGSPENSAREFSAKIMPA